MINVILLFIPVLILLILSSAITQKFNYKIEHSNFLVVCSIALFLILFGLIGILDIGFYIIIALSLISLLYLIASKFSVKLLFTPSMLFYILGIFVFAFLIRDIQLFWHDEVSHWALSTKSMYYSNCFYKGLQTMLTPTFNYFITKCSGFGNEQLYTGAWILIWTSFLLPTGGTKWCNWKRILIYFIAAYCLTGYIIKEAMFHTDELLGIISGCLAAYWAIQKKKGIKEYILVILGLLAVSQIKDSYGAMVSIIIALFIITSEIVENHDNFKKIIPKLFIISLTPIIGYFLSQLTLNKPEGYLSQTKFTEIPLIIQIINSKMYILIFIISIIFLILFLYFLNNKKIINIKNIKIHLYKIIGVTLIVSTLLLVYKTSMLLLQGFNYEESKAFIKAWRDYFYSTSGGSTNLKTTACAIILIGFACGFALKKDLVKLNIVRCIVILCGILTMGFFVLVSFSLGFDETGMYTQSVSWERYTSVPFIIMLTYIIGYYMLAPNIYLKSNYRVILISLCMLLLIKYLPYPGAIMYTRYAKERDICASLSNMVKDDGDIIRAYLDKDDTVFVASYKNEHDLNEYGNGRSKWLKYEIAPIKSNWNYFKGYDDDTGYEGTVDEYLNRISTYDYYYVHSAGPLFYDKFGSIFPDNKLYWTKALYKVVNNNGKITLEPVYIDESKPVS